MLNSVLYMQAEIANLYMKKHNLTVQEFLELDKKFDLLDFIALSYEPFHLMGNQGILNEIQEWIEQGNKLMEKGQ